MVPRAQVLFIKGNLDPPSHTRSVNGFDDGAYVSIWLLGEHHAGKVIGGMVRLEVCNPIFVNRE